MLRLLIAGYRVRQTADFQFSVISRARAITAGGNGTGAPRAGRIKARLEGTRNRRGTFTIIPT